jgi:hypothetical protein
MSTVLGYVFASGLAVGAFGLLYSSANGAWDLATRLLQFRRRRFLRRAMVLPPGQKRDLLPIPEEDYLGLSGTNWQMVQVVTAILGLAVAYLVFAETSPLFALVGLLGGLAPRLAMKAVAAEAQWRHLREIRDFITSLRLAVTLNETLSRALMDIAGREEGYSLFARRLRHHLDTRLSTSPEAVIGGLAEDFRSKELRDLLLRLEAARRGGLSFAEALLTSAREVEAEIQERVEMSIEDAPARLLLPTLVGFFPNVFILLILPLAMTVLAGIQGVR